MSPRNSTSGPKTVEDVYVGLMILSTTCLLAGIGFLVATMASYDWTLP